MALQTIDRRGLRRAFKRRRKHERRVRRMERAVRWNLYVGPIAKLVDSLTRVFRSR